MHDMIRPSAEAAEGAGKKAIESGLSEKDLLRLRELVNRKVNDVHEPIKQQAGGEFEETWEFVNSKDPRILAAAEEFISNENLAGEGIIIAVREFVKAQAVFHITLGFYQSPSMDFDDFD